VREPLYVLGHADSELDPGDVSFVAADIVGAAGSVVGVARSPRARAQEASLSNTAFHVADIGALDDGRAFDAVVGRFVLMHQADAQRAGSVRLLSMCARAASW